MQPRIILFDIDGVLIQPGGYRRAMIDTCRHFLGQAGLANLAPDDDVYACFESQRVTSEWDMVPLALLVALDHIAGEVKIPVGTCDLRSAMLWARGQQMDGRGLNYQPAIRKMGAFVRPGLTAAEGILQAIEDGSAVDLFPHLIGSTLVNQLLSTTRMVLKSETTRKFQEYAIGYDAYLETYGCQPDERFESYLLTYDRALLDDSHRDLILNAIGEGSIWAAIYTARPSLPPLDAKDPRDGYSPEAELAVEQAGLSSLPLIGYGKLGWLAGKVNGTIPEFIKPAAGQALAATAAAWTGAEGLALEWAAKLTRQENIDNIVELPTEFDLVILEDSAAGIQGGRAAVEILERIGYKIRYVPVGITRHPEKVAALQKSGAQIFPDINAALDDVLL